MNAGRMIALRCRIVVYFLMIGWIFRLQPAGAQDYAITKLKLFPDRDEVLIKDVTRDSQGFIWFLTNGEIYRYDGYRSLDILETLADQQLTDDMPQRILVDQKNRLWMAGNASLNYLDLKTWKVHPTDPDLQPAVPDRAVYWIKKINNSAVMVAYENGHLLLIEDNRSILIDDLYKLSTSSGNNKVLPRSGAWWKGKYWIGTSVGTLLSIDPAQGYSTAYHSIPGISSVIMSLIAQQDKLTLDVLEQGVFQLGEKNYAEKIVTKGFTISSDKFNVLQQGTLFHVYADEESACILDSNLNVLQRLEMPSLHRFRTASVNIEESEVLLGNEEGIFIVYPKSKGLSELIPANYGANKSTRGIYVYPDGAIFYGSYNGAGYMEKDGTVYILEDIKHAYALLPMNENELLVGTEGGFLKIFDREKRRIKNLQYTLSDIAQNLYRFNLPDYVLSLAETDTDFLIGSTNGLWLLNKESRSLSRFEANSEDTRLSDLHVRHIKVIDKRKILLSTNLGLFELNQQTLTKRYPKSGNLGIYKSLFTNDTLWIATQGKGLVAIDTKGEVKQTFTTSNGLSNNIVYSLEYADGVLIAGTADGLNLVRNQQLRRIGMAEGLRQTEFNSGASFWDAPRKRIYIGGLMGYTILDLTQHWFDNPSQLESFVTETHTSASNTEDRLSNYTWPYNDEQTLTLRPGQSLSGLYIGTPGNYRTHSSIRYSLNYGDWEQLGPGQYISLIEPSPGNYHIRLETLSTRDQGRLREFTIIKQPHYYQTWWFNGLIIILIIGFLLLWYRSRIAKIRREQAIRNRIAADLHDEVGSSLTRIFFQANTLARSQIPLKNQEKQLELIAKTSKQALLTMSDMVWSIDSRFDTMKDLVIRMKDYVYRLREELNFAYRFREEGNIESGKVSQSVRQNLFMIFKEALTNAIKYSGGSEITILLHLDENIRLEITNSYGEKHSGVAHRQGGRGIENMKRRASKVGGRLIITNTDRIFKVVFELLPKRGI